METGGETMTPRLSKRSVEALTPGLVPVFAWDSAVRGFGVRVTPAGARAYVYQYRFGGATRRLTIGRHGDPWTVEQAREQALEYARAVAHGRDPAAELGRSREMPTLSAFAVRYLREHVSAKRKPSSLYDYRLLLEVHVLPHLGRKKLSDITRADVARLHADVGRGKLLPPCALPASDDAPPADAEAALPARKQAKPGGRAKGGRYAANRCLALLKSMFTLAEKWGVLADGWPNPCRHVDRFKEAARERLLTPEELGTVGRVLAEAERNHAARAAGLPVPKDEIAEPPTAVAALRFLILTGARLNEALGAEWDWLDTEAGCLRLPDSKTGPKAVPLGAAALELLASLPRVPGNPYIFPGRRTGSHFVGLAHVWQRVRARAGIGPVRIHDLRHAYASTAVLGGASMKLVGALLGHARVTTTERYAHTLADPVRAAADKTAAELSNALAGRAPAAVVPMEAPRR